MFLGQWLTQKPIGAYHRRFAGAAVEGGVIDHQQMLADRVISIDVAACEQSAGIGDGGTFLVENSLAQFLRLANFGGGLRQPHLKRADTPQALRRPKRARGPGLQAAIGLQRRKQIGDAGIGDEVIAVSHGGRSSSVSESAIAFCQIYTTASTRIYDRERNVLLSRRITRPAAPGARRCPTPRADARD